MALLVWLQKKDDILGHRYFADRKISLCAVFLWSDILYDIFGPLISYTFLDKSSDSKPWGLHGNTQRIGILKTKCAWEKLQRYLRYVLSYKCNSKTAKKNSILITNLIHWLLFIHKILFSCTCFELQVLIFRRIQLYTCNIWYRHSLWEFLVVCRYRAWVRTDCRGKVVGGCLKTDMK